MANETQELMDRMLRSVGEDANAEIPFARLHDGILLAKKRAEKKRRNLIRSLSAAASFVVLLGVGALFMGHMAPKSAMDAAESAPMAPMAYDTAAIVEEAPMERDISENTSFTYSNEAAEGSMMEPAAPIPTETDGAAVPEAEGIVTEMTHGPASDSLLTESTVVLLGKVTALTEEDAKIQVLESYLGAAEASVIFPYDGTELSEGESYLFLLDEQRFYPVAQGSVQTEDGTFSIEEFLKLLGIS